MKFISPIISDARGSLGGTTFARNTSGTFARARKAPTQPRTVSQQANRAMFAGAATAWKGLTQAQIAAWITLAPLTTWTDSLGHTFSPSGNQLFIQCQRNLQSSGNLPQLNAPAAPPTMPSAAPISINAVTTAGVLTTLTVSGPAALMAQPQNLVLQMTAPFSPTISFVNPAAYRRILGPYATDGTAVNETIGTTGTAPNGVGGSGQAFGPYTPLVAGTLTSFVLGWETITTPGANVYAQIIKLEGSVVQVLASFTIKAPSAAGETTYTAPTEFSPLTVPAGCYLVIGNDNGNFVGFTTGLTGVQAIDTGPLPVSTGDGYFIIGNLMNISVTTTTYTGGTMLEVLAAYLALFSGSALGQKIGAKLRLVDPSTGYTTPSATATTIVTGT